MTVDLGHSAHLQKIPVTVWVEQMGFEIARDETYGDERWIEVSPPGQSLVGPCQAISHRLYEPSRSLNLMLYCAR